MRLDISYITLALLLLYTHTHKYLLHTHASKHTHTHTHLLCYKHTYTYSLSLPLSLAHTLTHTHTRIITQKHSAHIRTRPLTLCDIWIFISTDTNKAVHTFIHTYFFLSVSHIHIIIHIYMCLQNYVSSLVHSHTHTHTHEKARYGSDQYHPIISKWIVHTQFLSHDSTFCYPI
jgi:hypothetical protein